MTRSIATLARDYYELTKPGILKLLVLTTFCTMLVAEGGWPDWGLVFWTVLGTALISGSANTINMVWDTDIDAIMARTRNRPLVRGAMTPRQALVFSGLIGLLAVAILTFFANPLAALMAIAGHVFYVVIYTMWLKRRTPQNIVIGGAAGAFPPLIGWAAVTGDLSVTAWLIFTVIFLWTPPHFWALALYKDIEYGKAGVPMMPVVRGHDVTKYQMLVYTLLLLTVTLALGLTGVLGIIYLVSAVFWERDLPTSAFERRLTPRTTGQSEPLAIPLPTWRFSLAQCRWTASRISISRRPTTSRTLSATPRACGPKSALKKFVTGIIPSQPLLLKNLVTFLER